MTKMIGTKTKLTSFKQWALAGAASIVIAQSAALAQAAEIEFDIDAANLGDALSEFGMQSGKEIIFVEAETAGKTTKGVEGVYAPDEALEVLLDGSGIEYRTNKLGTVLVGTVAARQASLDEDSQRGGIFRLAQADTGVSGAVETIDDRDADEEKEKKDEIIVTGSHIRGAGPVGSQVLTFDRDDIDMKGYSTIPEFIQSLPQNFNGGASESTFGLSTANRAGENFSSGTGINLRGLGNGSTLVLLNGQRLAPVGSSGGFVDISMIPLSAVERVEVLTDGASAIYGSDAIGGVVNFILRKDYDGAETRVRYGGATGGGLEEVLVGQTFGKVWDRGHGLVSYEYSHRGALDAQDRSFSIDAPQPNDLLPEQERHSVFLTGGQELTNNLEVSATAYYNKRTNDRNLFFPPSVLPSESNRQTEQYGGTLGVAIDLDSSVGNGWRAEVVGSYSHSEFISKRRIVAAPESDSPIINRASENLSVDINLDGSLFHMPGGDAKLAIGGHFRDDALGDLDLPDVLGIIQIPIDDLSRNVYAVFSELYLPVVGAENRRPGVERLEFSISGRYENYSDFGASTDPKFGVLWSPIEGLDFHGTWGTSFRAPLLTEKDESGNSALLIRSPAFGGAGADVALLLLGGGNQNVQPEGATIWTAGMSFQPPALSGLKVSANYFNVEYKDRIATPVVNFFDLLGDPNSASLANFDGINAELFARIENYFQSNATLFPGFGPGADFTDADVLFTALIQNLAFNKVEGLDFSASYDLATNSAGNLNFFVSGTYLFNFINQVSKLDPAVDVVDTINNPLSLKFNGGITWNYEGLTTNFIVNHVNSYVDDRTATSVPVDAWTTANLILSYNTEGRVDGLLKDTIFSLSAVNLFDQDPPFLATLRGGTNINYDPSAASPTGRVLSFQITKQW